MEKLYVIDASGYLYRSYFAIRNMSNSKGESTNALFGFIRSVQKLQKDFHPKYLVAVFDGPQGAKKRTAIYADYKAHRKAMPQDLGYQIKWAQHFCDLAGIPHLVIPEVEADDTMGSIAVFGKQQGIEVYLCTSDKDLCQFVDSQTKILNTHKENQILGPEGVKDAYGVFPEQIVDFLAIVGDASDNVPGLPGFGPKTASAILQEHGSLDAILKNPDVFSGKKKETILSFGSQALLSRALVTIDTSVDIPHTLNFYQVKKPEIKELKDFYHQMGFNSLLKDLEQYKTDNEKNKEESKVFYTLVNSEDALDKLIDHLKTQKHISIDTETTDLHPMKAELVGIGFGTEAGECWYIPLNGTIDPQSVLKKIKPLLENPHIGFYGHNIKYDFQVLQNYDLCIANICFDTMLASYLLNSQSRQHNLDHLALESFEKVKIPISDLIGKGKSAITMDKVPLDKISVYCCEDVDYTIRLKNLFEKQLKEKGLSDLLFKLELPLLSVLAKMERKGIYLDALSLKKTKDHIEKEIDALTKEIYNMAGGSFNLNSPKQLSVVLFENLGIKPPKKTATGFSTNVDVLENLKDEYPIAEKILAYRSLEKLRSTYIETLPEDINPKTHRIHCTFNQSVAATGRLSCQNPNLQNIPVRTKEGKEIREAFTPQSKDFSFLAADYSQIELRLLAHFSEDPHLMAAFKRGEDIHKDTAAHIFDIPLKDVSKQQRHAAKAVNFGIIYGQQAFGLSKELGIEIKEAAKFIELYFQRYSKVQAYLEECKEKARRLGFAATFMGRIREIPEINSKNMQMKALAERLAINTPLQGTAADMIKQAMLQIDKRIKKEDLQSAMILQIHDELIFEVPDTEIKKLECLVKEEMESAMQLKVPLVVDIAIGKNWAEC